MVDQMHDLRNLTSVNFMVGGKSQEAIPTLRLLPPTTCYGICCLKPVESMTFAGD